MNTDLNGKVAVITGASSGMGQASARAMAQAGAKVALAGRDPDRLEATRASIEQAGGEAIAVTCDLSDAGQAVTALTAAVEAFGTVTSLVHCAGTFAPVSLEETTVENLDNHWAVNVRAPFLLTQAAVPRMSDGGTVLFVSSTVAHRGFGGYASYTASKGAVEAMARSLAMELAPRVRVNVLAPGFVATPMVTSQYEANPEMEGWLVDRTPLNFVGEAHDIANAVLFLSSDASRYITGATLVADGGWTVQG